MQELYGVDYSIDSPEDTTALLDVSQDYVDGCEQNAGDLLPYLGTEDVARDIDAVRAAMGDDQLNYLGFSYGTAIGQQLAELFPERVRAMIIDGIVDLGPTGVETAVDQAAGFETALQSFADDCNADASCPIAPRRHRARSSSCRTRSSRRPIPAIAARPRPRRAVDRPGPAALQRDAVARPGRRRSPTPSTATAAAWSPSPTSTSASPTSTSTSPSTASTGSGPRTRRSCSPPARRPPPNRPTSPSRS